MNKLYKYDFKLRYLIQTRTNEKNNNNRKYLILLKINMSKNEINKYEFKAG